MATTSARDLFSVKDQVFVITGGGSGLGEWMAQAFDANGASKVFILGRRQASLDRVVASAINKKIIAIQCDITSKDSLAAAATSIASQTPFVNVVIASAAILGPVTSLPSIAATESIDEIYKQLWGTSQAENAAVLDMNVVSVYNVFVAFLRLLDAGNTHADSPGDVQGIQSQFLTISSTSGIQRRSDTGHMYMSSKAGLVHLTKTLSTEFGPYGIRANCIAPGLFITEMTGGYFSEQTAKIMSLKGGLPKEANPATRTGTPEDIIGTALYLTSRAGAYVNGSVIVLDGGSTAVTPSTY